MSGGLIMRAVKTNNSTSEERTPRISLKSLNSNSVKVYFIMFVLCIICMHCIYLALFVVLLVLAYLCKFFSYFLCVVLFCANVFHFLLHIFHIVGDLSAFGKCCMIYDTGSAL